MGHFISPKKIYHGEGSLNMLETILQELQVQKVFLLSDPILKELGVIEPLLKQFEKAQVEVDLYTGVEPEPSVQVGNDILERVRKSKPDLVVGVGGGSAMDLAKTAAALYDNEGQVEDYLNLTGQKSFVSKGLPKVLIPSTAGTGAEVTNIAAFSLEDSKDVVTHDFMLADFAIVDPVLTYTSPSKVTAASGIDAFTHALEAYTSINATPLTDALAIDAMTRIVGSIRTAVWNGQDKQAREEMALGSLIAGLSFFNAGAAGVHALAYPIGGLFKIPHGESNAVMLPYVYDFIFPACLDKMVKVAEIFGISAEGKTKRQMALEVVRSIQELVKDVGVSAELSDYGIAEDDIERLAVNGVEQKRLLGRSPRKLDLDAIRSIYTNAYHGVLTSS
ncbi:iron-containing alcohol dehydrogenase [Planococcus salinus]|uniref:Iron-containing alcohol dehydrogenase n=1 Tax=Planococcus salinus TaxID=1848460 RepID=A0A3M8P781_9BACL|nr:iron-containing alcohol dehydrogenase [Planococcus salinus]RNF39538.1 iron-containing alcohol dehydrogenase [Planococcus salinus]